MTLGELINVLEAVEDKSQVCRWGFVHPHSYRGYYNELAFEPMQNVSVEAMLRSAKGAEGAVYRGWKGGDYLMSKETSVYLAHEGSTGDELSPMVLDLMLGAIVTSPPPKSDATFRPPPAS